MQAFAASVIGLDPTSQTLLINYIANALAGIAQKLGCDLSLSILADIQGTMVGAAADSSSPAALPAVSPAQMLQLCGAVSYSCPAICSSLGLGQIAPPPPCPSPPPSPLPLPKRLHVRPRFGG